MNADRPRRRIPLVTPVVWAAALLALCCTCTAFAAASPSSVPPVKPKINLKLHATLGGTWTGSYSGVFSGTFTIKWRQVKSRLVGSIKLSKPSGTYRISGSVTSKNTIKFGAVGAGATYKGVVHSSTSMSGTYNTPMGPGTWSASKGS